MLKPTLGTHLYKGENMSDFVTNSTFIVMVICGAYTLRSVWRHDFLTMAGGSLITCTLFSAGMSMLGARDVKIRDDGGWGNLPQFVYDGPVMIGTILCFIFLVLHFKNKSGNKNTTPVQN